MTALAADKNTPYMDGEMLSVPVAAVKCYAGGIAAFNAAGYIAPGITATTLTYWGRFEETVDNSGGAAGDLNVLVRRKKAFKWANSGGDPIAQADVGAICYIEDDQTVAKTNGGATRSAAGTVVQVDSDGIWVQ